MPANCSPRRGQRQRRREEAAAALLAEREVDERRLQDRHVLEEQRRPARAAFVGATVERQALGPQVPVGVVRAARGVGRVAHLDLAAAEELDPLGAAAAAGQRQVEARRREAALVRVELELQLRAGEHLPLARDPHVADRDDLVVGLVQRDAVGAHHGAAATDLGVALEGRLAALPAGDGVAAREGGARRVGHEVVLAQLGLQPQREALATGGGLRAGGAAAREQRGGEGGTGAWDDGSAAHSRRLRAAPRGATVRRPVL